MFKEQLRDVLTHTHGLNFIEMIKLDGDKDEVKVSAIDEDKTVVIYGNLKKAFQENSGITDYTIGLARMGILSGYLKYPLFDSDNASITMETMNKDNEDVPCELKFDSNDGHVSTYRFMDKSLAENLIKVPPFKGATWDVTFEPSKQNLTDLKYFAGILSEPLFTVRTDGDELIFDIGCKSGSYSSVPFAKNITGSLKHAWSYPMNRVKSILMLSDPAICEMSFSDQGALKITIDSGIGEYEYILPAQQT